MADAVIYFLGVVPGSDAGTVPIRVTDNGDGTYSLATGGASGGTASEVTSPQLPDDLGQQIADDSLSVVLASDEITPVDPGIVTTVGLSNVVIPTIVVSTGIYAVNDVVGGEITLTGALRAADSTGVLQSVLIKDNSNQKAPLTLLFFNENPAGTFTDNGACPDLTADLSKIVRKVNIAAIDYETIGTVAIADVSAVAKMVKAGTSSGDLWLVIVTTGTPTYGATSDLIVHCGFLEDY